MRLLNGGADAVNLNVACHVSGWKSIMGNPDKKKRSRSQPKGTGSQYYHARERRKGKK